MFNLVSKKVTDCVERNKFGLLVLLGILLFLAEIVIASSVLIFIGACIYLLLGGAVDVSPWLYGVFALVFVLVRLKVFLLQLEPFASILRPLPLRVR